MKITLSLVVALTGLLCASCEKDKAANPALGRRSFTQVSGPMQGQMGDSIRLQVSWSYSTGCDVFEKFVTDKTGPVYSIKGWGYMSKGICTHDAGIKIKEYVFYSTIVGSYQLKFLNPDGSSILHSLVIN